MSPRVLFTLLAVPAVLAIALIIRPVWTFAALAATVALALAGGGAVALQARLARDGIGSGQGSEGLLRASAAVFAGAAGVLIFLCAPGPYFKDAGELAASAHVLGVAHPTGFSLFCLLGKAFDLLPLGNAFFRLNCLSAVMMALAAAFAFALAARIDGEHGAARKPGSGPPAIFLVAPAAFLASNTVWLHGTTTEVYALSMAGLGATVSLFAGAAFRRDARMLALGWFGVGLGLGGHITWPIYGCMAGLALSCGPSRPGGWKGAAYMFVALAAGAMVVLYLPSVASRDPIMNWGDPSGLSALWSHMSGARIRHSFNDQVAGFNLAELHAHASMTAGILWRGTGPVWPLAVVGVVRSRKTRIGWILLAIAAADFMFASWVNPMGTWDLQTLVSATWAVSVLATLGVAGLWRGAKSGRGRTVVAAAAMLAVGLQAWMAGADRDMTGVNGARLAGSRLLDTAPIGASLLTTSDDLSAGLTALQVVENARPDILQLVRQHVSDTGYVRRQIRAHRAFDADEELLRTLDESPFEGYGEDAVSAQSRLLSALGGRGAVFIEPGSSHTDAGIRRRMVPGFPAYSLETADVETPRAVKAVDKAVSDALDTLPGCDRWGRAYIGVFLRLLAMHVALTGAGDDLAVDVLRKALVLNPGDSRTLQNLGVLVFNSGRRAEGLELMRRSVSIDAAYLRGWKTLARYAAIAGENDLESAARSHLEALSR